MKKEWLHILRDKLKTYEEQPPEGLWEDIQKQLAVQESAVERPLFPLWSKILISTAAAVIIALLIFTKSNPDSDIIIDQEHREMALVNVLDNQEPTTNIEPSSNANSYHQVTAAIKPDVIRDSYDDMSSTKIIDLNHSSESAIETDNSNSENHSIDSKESISVEKPNNTIIENEQIIRNTQNTNSVIPRSQLKRKRPHRISINLFAENASKHEGTKSEYGRDYVQLAASSPNSEDETQISPASREVNFFNQNKEIKEETKHDFPLTIGITASYGITNNLSIESGLIYTYLSSRTKKGTPLNYQETAHYQHLIGLPIILKYDIWEGKTIKVYGAIGGMIQRSISASSDSKYIIDGKNFSGMLHQKEPNYYIWSIQGAVGMRYNIYSNVGLYIEPGISYHFSHDGIPKSIYTESPLKFNLSVGINFSF